MIVRVRSGKGVSHRLWLHTQTCVKSGHTKFQFGGRNPHEAPLLTEELLAAESCWGREHPFPSWIQPPDMLSMIQETTTVLSGFKNTQN